MFPFIAQESNQNSVLWFVGGNVLWFKNELDKNKK